MDVDRSFPANLERPSTSIEMGMSKVSTQANSVDCDI